MFYFYIIVLYNFMPVQIIRLCVDISIYLLRLIFEYVLQYFFL